MLEQLDADRRERALALVPDATLRAVREGGTLSWLEGEHHLSVDGALFEVLGAEGYEQLSRDFTLRFARRPLMSPLVQSTRRLSRGDPSFVVGRLPLAWKLIFRGFGEVEVTSGKEVTVLTHTRIPIALRHDDSFSHGIIGSLLGVAELFGHKAAKVSLNTTRRSLGEVRYNVAWQGDAYSASASAPA